MLSDLEDSPWLLSSARKTECVASISSLANRRDDVCRYCFG
ncbi:hypothetical protein M7I_6990 [Glarea lozoyensis 74030]|uniref:Uncharacterized protein n=1 Tax=Glarea lozoyensis (strain ATCC 74030 / MF5533) TaxID=1104152 RepID=H0EW14_GLAL7|nr:hypothetical protein M7I_6990 [Glarea lozoyensis 74030]